MALKLDRIDHVHVMVTDRDRSEHWYARVLGFTRIKALEFWAVDGGPLTLSNPDDSVHIALFQAEKAHSTTIAFATSAQNYLDFHRHVREQGIEVEHEDHQVSWSFYFRDPDGNPFEITTYDYAEVKARLEAPSGS